MSNVLLLRVTKTYPVSRVLLLRIARSGGMNLDRYGMAWALVVVHNSARHKRALAVIGGG